jgi:hypothetical protein
VSLPVARSKLVKSHQELQYRLDPVRRAWDDRGRRAFEERYIEPLDGATRATVSAIEHMEQVLARARGECQ